MPNFVPIGQTVAEVWRFLYFQDGGRPILDFQILEILTVGTLERAKLHYRAKFRWSRSNSARDMTIFRFSKMAAAAILHFWIFQISNSRKDHAVLHHCAKLSSKSFKLRPRYGDFSIFQDCGPQPYWILNMEILTAGTLKRAKLRYIAKFLRNWSNRSRHMAIFRFLRWRPPPSWVLKFCRF